MPPEAIGSELLSHVQALVHRKLAATALEGLAAPVFIVNPSHEVVVWNAACESLTGLPAAEVLGTPDSWRAFYDEQRATLADLVIEGYHQRSLEELQLRYPGRKVGVATDKLQLEGWFRGVSRIRRYLIVEASPLLDEEGRLAGAVEVLFDITEHKRAQDQLTLSAQVFESSHEGIVIVDPEGNVVSTNSAYRAIIGEAVVDSDETPPLSALFPSVALYAEALTKLRSEGLWTGQFSHLQRDGGSPFVANVMLRLVTPENDPRPYMVGVLSDVTELHASALKMRRLAHYDFLTQLPNRGYFMEHLASATEHARQAECAMAVLFIDLDRFKMVNDSLGHSVGDQLLQITAQRLQHAVRQSDMVGRLGGDEFVVMLPVIASPEAAGNVATKLLTSLSAPYVIDGNTLTVTPSIGVAVYPRDGEDAEALLQHADVAMYYAKNHGRANYTFFDRSMTLHVVESLHMENNLRSALSQDEFHLVYQPQADIATGRIVGIEVLLRWTQANGQAISPTSFIPVAEELGLISAIGAWVLRTACRTAADLRARGLLDVPMFVNLSALQLQYTDLIEQVGAALAEFNLPPSALGFEVTEGLLMKDTEFNQQVLKKLKAMGITLAIDDFGTGYSSLTYLKKFPLDVIKLDKSFIKDIGIDVEDELICQTVIQLGHALNMQIVAEGVETEEQHQFLQAHGCTSAQGYLISYPLPVERLAQFLEDHPNTVAPASAD